MDELGQLVQTRIEALQNPNDCESARKLVCDLTKICGFGCQVHHLAYCLIVAYATNRTLILKSQGWRYNRNGWHTVFQPLSRTCTDVLPGGSRKWSAPDAHRFPVVQLPIIGSLSPHPPYLPNAIPKELSERLIRAHGDPAVWWVGQFASYLLRPLDPLREFLVQAKKKLRFHNESPIVGVHIRRTDKVGTEASFHSLEEYFKFVELFFEQEEKRRGMKLQRRAFIATDDPLVIEEARRNMSSYEILGDPMVAKTASLSSRYSFDSLRNIVLDIHVLSKCSYLVCTFSSNVCRLSYELMQTDHADASHAFKSLDDVWYFGGGQGKESVALEAHEGKAGE
ncbi:unnamed protein product [Cyprideis torosa]|uniref:Uncharacterized protein n=1 Tax=Cyprideis torosa TaxID=163714 RepID=A0A7R8ZU05_9CRUS|nr:unnamed protein product [Cyprideis torosa]CAG0899213.1 unnamed protein product [Cyprideis torosa]